MMLEEQTIYEFLDGNPEWMKHTRPDRIFKAKHVNTGEWVYGYPAPHYDFGNLDKERNECLSGGDRGGVLWMMYTDFAMFHPWNPSRTVTRNHKHHAIVPINPNTICRCLGMFGENKDIMCFEHDIVKIHSKSRLFDDEGNVLEPVTVVGELRLHLSRGVTMVNATMTLDEDGSEKKLIRVDFSLENVIENIGNFYEEAGR